MTFKPIEFRIPNHYDTKEASEEATVKDFGESLTIQSQAEDADLNVMMKRFGITGKMPDDVRPVFYGDFDKVFDFRTAQHALIDAQQQFDMMPADVRARFSNDPQRFLEFCSASDDGTSLKNIDEMRKLGLAIPEKKAQNVAPPPPKEDTK